MQFLLVSLLLVTSAFAHTDLSKTIEALTGKIAKNPTAELYYQRATEYRALREKEHAIEDLRAALELNPKYREAKLTLAETLGSTDEALELAISLAANSRDTRSSIQPTLLQARIHQQRGDYEKAFEVTSFLHKLTLKARQNETEIDLLHADILLDLNRPAEATTVLKAAWERTESIVLRNNWIDTALTAGQTKDILPNIEKELRSSRLRSSWLIRRARALLVLGNEKAARTDLLAALVEIEPRINPKQPDLTLIADRGLIHALMGNAALARRDLGILKKTNLPASAYRLLSSELPEAEGKSE